MTITTLCYIENDDKYLMLHRVKKQNDINKVVIVIYSPSRRRCFFL